LILLVSIEPFSLVKITQYMVVHFFKFTAQYLLLFYTEFNVLTY
jgi:hypothetical protein